MHLYKEPILFLTKSQKEKKKFYQQIRPMHERILKAERSLLKLIRENTLFTYLADFPAPFTNNRIEGGINSRLRETLRNHRGLFQLLIHDF